MASVLSNPQHQARIGYNGFPMDQRLSFSSTVGELTMVMCDLLEPDDKVSCGSTIKTRTQPLESAAYVDITQRIEWFFVPLEHLFTPFGSWFYGVQDLKSALFNQAITKYFPHLSKETITEVIKTIARGYTNFGDPSMTTLQNYPSPGQTKKLVRTESPIDQLAPSYFSECAPTDWIRFVNQFLPILEIMQDFVNSSLDSPNANSLVLPNSTQRKWQIYDSFQEDLNFPMHLVAMFMAAYQKVYMDYYRLSDREENDVRAYNFDQSYQTGNIPMQQLPSLFRLRYRPWSRDYFMVNHISPLMSDTAVSALNYNSDQDGQMLGAVSQWLSSTIQQKATDPSGESSIDPTTVRVGGQNSSTGPTAPTTASIRTAFAVEKLLEITRRAGKHYKDQVLAHIGANVPQGISDEVYYLGKQQSDIVIGDVIATAGTESTPLGSIGGKGYGYGQGSGIHFTAPCHGILIAIHSAEPLVDYTPTGIDRLNTLVERDQWFDPEYDDLGQQPLFMYESYLDLRTQAMLLKGYEFGPITYYGDTLGWNWRYLERKLRYSKTRGALSRFGSMASWKPSKFALRSSNISEYLINPSYLNQMMLVGYQLPTAFTDGVYDTLRTDPDAVSPSFFNDYYMDNMFMNFFSLYDRDPLHHELVLDYTKASKMSTYGLPSL